MITAIVSAIEGPISSVVSGCLGESGVWQMWPWRSEERRVGKECW